MLKSFFLLILFTASIASHAAVSLEALEKVPGIVGVARHNVEDLKYDYFEIFFRSGRSNLKAYLAYPKYLYQKTPVLVMSDGTQKTFDLFTMPNLERNTRLFGGNSMRILLMIEAQDDFVANGEASVALYRIARKLPLSHPRNTFLVDGAGGASIAAFTKKKINPTGIIIMNEKRINSCDPLLASKIPTLLLEVKAGDQRVEIDNWIWKHMRAP